MSHFFILSFWVQSTLRIFSHSFSLLYICLMDTISETRVYYSSTSYSTFLSDTLVLHAQRAKRSTHFIDSNSESCFNKCEPGFFLDLLPYSWTVEKNVSLEKLRIHYRNYRRWNSLNLLKRNVSLEKLRIHYRIEFIGFISVFILSVLALI